MSYAITIGLALGTSQTGLSLEAQPVNTAGANVGSAITTGFVEYGAGQYAWSGSLPDGHTGGVKFQLAGGGAFKAFAPINPQEVENPDAKTSTRSTYAGGAVASVTGNVGGVVAPVTVGSNTDKTGYSLASAPPSASAITNAVLNELLSAHTTPGSVGAGIDAASAGASGADPLADPYPGAYADGTYGAYLRDKLALINAGQIVIASPINLQNNTITLIRGDAYNAATRRLLWTLTGYPDLSGAQVRLKIKGGLAFIGSVISHATGGAAQVVAVDITPGQSAALAGQLFAASATVILASGDPMTFWIGSLDARSKAAT
jgi:hypothetical protein